MVIRFRKSTLTALSFLLYVRRLYILITAKLAINIAVVSCIWVPVVAAYNSIIDGWLSSDGYVQEPSAVALSQHKLFLELSP